ncbi:MAG: hypothetical protein LC798_12985 [Chloroflexi bacterium]|nr:hypothetical protein [Chloroflexota bacterium]
MAEFVLAYAASIYVVCAVVWGVACVEGALGEDRPGVFWIALRYFVRDTCR